MLKNAPTLAIVAVDTEENEPLKISLFHFIISIVSLPVAVAQVREEEAVSYDRASAGGQERALQAA